MPIQIWTRPVEADTTSIAAGIADAGRSMGRGMQNMAAKMERKKQEDKERADKAKQIRGMAKIFAKELDWSPGYIETAPASELSGGLMGHMEQEILKSKQAQRASDEERLKQFILQRREQEAQSRIPAELMRGMEPQMQRQPGDFPLNPEAFESRVTDRTGMSSMARNFIAAHAREGVAMPAGAMNEILQQGGRSEGPNAEMLARLGFVPKGGQMNPNGSASITFGEPDKPTPDRIIPVPTEGGGPSGYATFGDKLVPLPTEKSRALTDAQANALQYSERMKFNNGVLSKIESAGFNPAGAGAAVQNWTPNFMNSDAFQQYDAARKNWVSAVLRKESGAAISRSEEKGAIEQYFPAMGDSAGTVAQKAALRLLAEENMRRAVGEGIEPKRAPSAAQESAQFDSESAARSAGHKSGEIVLLYDPATRSYRRALLK